MDSLTGVIVVIPDTGRSIGIGAGDVAVQTVRGGVIKDLPKVGRGVEDLAQGDVCVACLEGGHLGDEGVVVGVEVGEEGGERGCIVGVEGGGFVECYMGGGWVRFTINRGGVGGWGEREKRRLTRHGIDHKIPHPVIIQILHQTKVFRHDLINRTRRILGLLPETLANIIDPDPHRHQQVACGPFGVRGGRDEVLLEIGDLGDDIGGYARVDDGVGDVGAVVGEIVG